MGRREKEGEGREGGEGRGGEGRRGEERRGEEEEEEKEEEEEEKEEKEERLSVAPNDWQGIAKNDKSTRRRGRGAAIYMYSRVNLGLH